MAVLRQNRTGPENIAETEVKENNQTKRKSRLGPVLASKLNRTPSARWRRNANDKKDVRAGQKNPRFEKQQREVPRSQIMYWLKRRSDIAQEKTLFLPRQRIRRIPPGLFPALYASLAILSIGGGLTYLISTQNQIGTTVSTSSIASATTDVTATTTNTNNPTITSTNTGTNTPVTNTNNDNDTNTSSSNNPINNSGNTVTVNNPSGKRRKRRSIRRGLFQAFVKPNQICHRRKEKQKQKSTEDRKVDDDKRSV